MCGLIASFNSKKKPVNEFIINQYEDQHARGEEGFGIIRINPQSIEIDRSTEPYKFLIDLYRKKSNIIIVHHRTPTSTKNLLSQTHPIFVSNKMLKHNYLFVHNGMIRNDDELKKEHEAIGFKYQTELDKKETEYSSSGYSYYQRSNFNDSESLAIEMALFIEGKIPEIRARGNLAFIALEQDKKTKKPLRILFGRKDNPLNMLQEKGSLKLSSEGPGEPILSELIFSFRVNDKNFKLSHQEMKFAKEETKEIPRWMGTTEKTPAKKEETTEKNYDVVELFKESIKNKSTEEIENGMEQMLETSEEALYDMIFEVKNELMIDSSSKTGEWKKQICLTIDEMKNIIVAAQAEIAVAESKELSKTETETEKEFLRWRGGNGNHSRTLEEENKTRRIGFGNW